MTRPNTNLCSKLNVHHAESLCSTIRAALLLKCKIILICCDHLSKWLIYLCIVHKTPITVMHICNDCNMWAIHVNYGDFFLSMHLSGYVLLKFGKILQGTVWPPKQVSSTAICCHPVYYIPNVYVYHGLITNHLYVI